MPPVYMCWVCTQTHNVHASCLHALGLSHSHAMHVYLSVCVCARMRVCLRGVQSGIGGYFGLFLGFSLLTVVEIVELLFVWVFGLNKQHVMK